jgi:hypothetical protein
MIQMNKPIDYITVESRSVKLLNDGLITETIVIDDSFQRRYVWVQKDRVSLIETILLGYPIPEIYLWQVSTDPDNGETIYSVVDGQQRLTTVQGFINGEFKLLKSSLDNKEADYAGKNFGELTPDQKSAIWKYPFSVRLIKESISRTNIVDLFLRLNRTNTTLNPQELRNAEFNGLFIETAAKIANLDFWEKWGIFNRSDIRRMLDIQFVSTLLLFIRSGIGEETTQASLNKAYDKYNENYPEAESDMALIVDTLTVVNNLIEGKTYTRLIVKKKTHFYTLFLYGYYLYNGRSDSSNMNKASACLDTWYKNYDEGTHLPDQSDDELLSEYKLLSQEGVQKKANRQRRFEILKEYVGI